MIQLSATAALRLLLSALPGVIGPDESGGYQIPCPFPTHSGSDHLHFDDASYRCFACLRTGSLSELTKVLGLYDSSRNDPTSDTRLATARLAPFGIRMETVQHFGLSCDSWGDTTVDAGSDVLSTVMIGWKPADQHARAEPVYNLDAIRGRDSIAIVCSLPDVWLMHQVGVEHAVAFVGGAERAGDSAACIASAGVKRARIFSEEGATAEAAALARALHDLGIQSSVHVLADEAGDPMDLPGLYRGLESDDAALRVHLAMLPEFAIDSVSAGTTGDESNFEPPIPLREVQTPAFPVEALPTVLRDQALSVSESLQVPADLPAMLALSALAAVLARKVEVQVGADWCEPVNLYTACAMPPASRKSAAFARMLAPLTEHDALMHRQYAAGARAAEFQRKILRQALERIETAAGKATDMAEREDLTKQALEVMTQMDSLASAPARLIVDDCTPERMVGLLQENHGRMALLSAEGGVFSMMRGRYSKNPDLSVYLKAHAGDMIRVDRMGRSEGVDSPALTIGICVQPDVLHGLMEQGNLHGSGLLARFLYILPASPVGMREIRVEEVESSASRQAREAYAEMAGRLLGLPFSSEDNGAPLAHRLTLDPEARVELLRFQNWVEPELREFGRLGGIADWGGKLAGAVVRIAGLLHMAEHSGDSAWLTPICALTMQRAVTIGHYLVPHAQAAYAQMGGDPVIADAEHISRWIEQDGRPLLSARDIFEGVKARLKKTARLRPALACLVEHHFLREQPQPKRQGPGRPASTVYEVNPRLYHAPPAPAVATCRVS